MSAKIIDNKKNASNENRILNIKKLQLYDE